MSTTVAASVVLDREFLDIRCRLIDLAASLDRIDRGDGASVVKGDLRMAQISEALGVLRDTQPARTERVQMIFSDAYDSDWRSK